MEQYTVLQDATYVYVSRQEKYSTLYWYVIIVMHKHKWSVMHLYAMSFYF